MFIEVFIALISLIAYYVWRKQYYWQKKGVYVPSYIPFIGHSHKLLLSSKSWLRINKIYNKKEVYEKPFWGMYEFTRPFLFVKDYDLQKNILVNDADSFVDRRDIVSSKHDVIFNEMLTMQKGVKWKNLRALLSPSFSSGKLKGMYDLTQPIADKLVMYFANECSEKGYTTLKKGFEKYQVNVIGSCGFGLEIDSFEKYSEFEKKVADFLSSSLERFAKFILIHLIPIWLTNLLRIKVFVKEVDSLAKYVRQTIEAREKTGIVRGDFIDTVMESYNQCQVAKQPKYPMTMNTAISSCLLFIVGGHSNNKFSLMVATFYLAKYPDIQDRLHQELKSISTDGNFDYNDVMTSPFLDACFQESLRMYSPQHTIERLCTKEYKIPDTNITIEKGTLVIIPWWSIAHDPEFFENPEEFNPDRFLLENKNKLKTYSLNAFGNGPRNCIGKRMAAMIVKIAVAKIFLKYKVSLAHGCDNLQFISHDARLKIRNPQINIVCELRS